MGLADERLLHAMPGLCAVYINAPPRRVPRMEMNLIDIIAV